MIGSVIFMFLLLLPFQNRPDSAYTNGIHGATGNEDMRVLYIGLTNRISVCTSGTSTNSQVYCKGCTSFTATDNSREFIVTVSGRKDEVEIYVEDQLGNWGRPKKVISWNYRVVSLPRPIITLENVSPYVRVIERDDFLRNELSVQMIGFPISITSVVTGGNIWVQYKGEKSEFNFVGNRIPDAPSLNEMIQPGALITIETRTLLGGKPVTPAWVEYYIK